MPPRLRRNGSRLGSHLWPLASLGGLLVLRRVQADDAGVITAAWARAWSTWRGIPGSGSSRAGRGGRILKNCSRALDFMCA